MQYILFQSDHKQFINCVTFGKIKETGTETPISAYHVKSSNPKCSDNHYWKNKIMSIRLRKIRTRKLKKVQNHLR